MTISQQTIELPAGVAVKPLEWRDHRPDSFPEPAWSSHTPFGFYNIEEVSASDTPAYVVRLHAHHFIADKDSLDEAKAAAQADYASRIMSALQPSDGWQPMDTAPRDGTEFIACNPGFAPFSCRCDSDGFFVHMSEDGIPIAYPFTRWRPLPAPPESEPRP